MNYDATEETLNWMKEELERRRRIESMRKTIQQLMELGFLPPGSSIETITLPQLVAALKKLEEPK